MNTNKSLYVERLSASTSFRKQINLSVNLKRYYLIFDSYWYLRAINQIRYLLMMPSILSINFHVIFKQLKINWSLKNILYCVQLKNLRNLIIKERIEVLYIDYENQLMDQKLIEYLDDLEIKIIGLQRFLIDRSDFTNLLPLNIFNEQYRPNKILAEGSNDYIKCLNKNLPKNLFFKLETNYKNEINFFKTEILHIYVILGPNYKNINIILKYLARIDENFQLELLVHPLNNSEKIVELFHAFNPMEKKDRKFFNTNSIIFSEANSFLLNLDGKCNEIILFSSKNDICYLNEFKYTKPIYAT